MIDEADYPPHQHFNRLSFSVPLQASSLVSSIIHNPIIHILPQQLPSVQGRIQE